MHSIKKNPSLEMQKSLPYIASRDVFWFKHSTVVTNYRTQKYANINKPK